MEFVYTIWSFVVQNWQVLFSGVGGTVLFGAVGYLYRRIAERKRERRRREDMKRSRDKEELDRIRHELQHIRKRQSQRSELVRPTAQEVEKYDPNQARISSRALEEVRKGIVVYSRDSSHLAREYRIESPRIRRAKQDIRERDKTRFDWGIFIAILLIISISCSFLLLVFM